MSPHEPELGAFGKLPSHGDFVRLGPVTPAVRALHEWLSGGTEACALGGATPPAHPIDFMFRDAASTGVVVGVLHPSRDSVGRRFPLSVYAVMDLAMVTPDFPVVPLAFGGFFAQALAVAKAAGAWDRATFEQHLAVLPPPRLDALQGARACGEAALREMPARVMLERLFGPSGSGQPHFGIGMLQTAAGQVRGRDPGVASACLDCPVSSDVELLFWLELVRRLVAWRATVPCVFWSIDPARLLVSLGAAPAEGFWYLADGSARGESLWPMRTDDGAAITHARRALSAMQNATLTAPDGHAGALLDALGGR